MVRGPKSYDDESTDNVQPIVSKEELLGLVPGAKFESGDGVPAILTNGPTGTEEEEESPEVLKEKELLRPAKRGKAGKQATEEIMTPS